MQDVERELSRKVGVEVQHINYGNYDGHRHSVSIVEGSPLHDWFNQSLESNMELFVNSYHHQVSPHTVVARWALYEVCMVNKLRSFLWIYSSNLNDYRG